MSVDLIGEKNQVILELWLDVNWKRLSDNICISFKNFGCQFSTEIVITEIVIKSLFQFRLINLFQNDESCEFFLVNDHNLG